MSIDFRRWKFLSMLFASKASQAAGKGRAPTEKLRGAFGNNHGARIIRAIFKDDSIRKQEHLRFVREEGWLKWAKPRFLLGRNNFHPGRNK